jgi:leucyl aminopeptidase (aminopeptidase T)
MTEPPQLIRQIVDTCLNVEDGENVWIQTWDHSITLASDIALACRQRGAHPIITLTTEDYWIRSFVETPKQLLEILPSNQSALLRQTDAFVFMLGPKSPIDWSKIPQDKQELADVWYLSSNRYTEQWRKISREHSVRILGIEYCLATEERSQVLGLNWQEWKKTMLAGCLVNQPEISGNCEKLSRKIREGHEVNIKTPFGTCLDFKLAGREVSIGDSIVGEEDAAKGIVKFLPSGFVEVAADEDSLEGTVVFDAPIIVKGGKRIEKLTLEFKQGRITEYHAQAGIEAFENYLKSGQGDLGKFAFFGLGLNPGLKHGFTQDDKVLGGVTIGIGGNEDKGGKNKTKGNSMWWASTTQATLQVDDALLVKSGHIV